MTDLTTLTLAEARAALANKEFTAVELADAHLSAIERARALNAFVVETPDKARAMAAAADVRIATGEARPLEGIPIAVKDLFCTAGVATSAGSHILDRFVPPYESTVTAQLWRDGAVMLGKTNNDEFAMGSSNETSVFGDFLPRAGDLALAPPGSQYPARAGRLLRRLGRGSRCLLGARCDRHRYGRLDSPAGGIHRHRRPETHLRSLLAMGHRGVRVLARPGRSLRA